MKNYLKLIFLIAAIAAVEYAYPAHIDAGMAQTAGKNFLLSKSIPIDGFQLAETKTIDGQTLYYIFNTGSKGFVIVTADDNAIPILGYSNESAWTSFIDTVYGNNVRSWMESYEKQILDVKTNNIPATEEITSQWQILLSGQAPKGTTTVVPPLLTTTWGQGWPYNSMCPTDPSGPGGHAWVGCVGTAMAQILKFWNGPTVGLGSFGYQSGSYPYTGANFNTSYNWPAMPNSTVTVNTNISTIMYHTSVSVMSQWGAGGTSVTYSSDEDPMTRAFKNYFKMSSSTMRYIMSSDYSSTQWDTYLQTELLAGRPIYYRGDGSFGHAWVCDGVDNANMYHFNFGWDGTYNGYYSLGNINPGGNTLTNNQHAIIGIKPNDGSTLTTNTTWSGTMNLTTNIWVPDSLTLTINAGAVIKFAPGCGLYIAGRLLCNGTATNYVKISASDTTAGWNGITWHNNYNARLVMANNANSQLFYTQIEYSQSCGITCIAYGKVVLDHCKINNNHGMWGAGVSIWFVPITMNYCELYNNHALSQGGGLLVTTTDTLSSDMQHNNFHHNVANGEGGGFYFMNVHNVIFSWNISDHNYAPNGAGGAMMYGTMSLVNNTLCNNTTPIPGGRGALHMENYSGNIVDMLIANNTANGIFCANSSPNIINSTIVNNNHYFGSGIFCDYNSDPHVKNCIVYGNVANDPTYGNQITLVDSDSDPFFDHCNIQGGLPGIGGPGSGSNYTTANYTNNIDLLPQFVAPSAGVGAGYDGLLANWQVQSTSPCINAGDITGISTLLPAVDLAGNPRITGIIDMGTYEYGCTPLPVSVAIVADANPVCSGTTVIFTATPVNGGSSPSYQWKKNGTNVGTNLPTYSYIPANNDVITCVLTSNLSCVSGNPATSNAISLSVNTPPTANAGTDQTIGYGASTTLNGSATGGSGNYTYHWEPASLLINSNIQNPTTINLTSSTLFTLTVTDVSSGCVGNDQTLVTVTGGILSVDVTATPNPSCAGDLVQLMSIPSGGTGNYTYMWSSNPPGFASTLPNPAVYPIISTTYILVIDDGFTTASDSLLIVVNPLAGTPNTPIGPDTVDMKDITESQYTISALENATSYTWDLSPANAGTITGSGILGNVVWNFDFLGVASVKANAVNACGESEWSTEKHTVVENTVGIVTKADCELVVYPNPVSGDKITISFCYKMERIEIVDRKGITLISKQAASEKYSLTHQLPSGVYFIKVIYNNGMMVKKIVVE